MNTLCKPIGGGVIDVVPFSATATSHGYYPCQGVPLGHYIATPTDKQPQATAVVAQPVAPTTLPATGSSTAGIVVFAAGWFLGCLFMWGYFASQKLLRTREEWLRATRKI